MVMQFFIGCVVGATVAIFFIGLFNVADDKGERNGFHQTPYKKEE